MADCERAFDVDVDAGDHKMSGTTRASSLGQLAEHAAERFGIRMNEVHEIMIKSSTIKITIIPSGIRAKERT